MNTNSLEGTTIQSEEYQKEIQKYIEQEEQKIKMQNLDNDDNFNLLKRVILLEERTRTYEDLQMQIKFLEEKMEEISSQGQQTPSQQKAIFEIEKNIFVQEDRIKLIEQKYEKFFQELSKKSNELKSENKSQQLPTDFEKDLQKIENSIKQNSEWQKQFEKKFDTLKYELDKQNQNFQTIQKQLKTQCDNKNSNQIVNPEIRRDYSANIANSKPQLSLSYISIADQQNGSGKKEQQQQPQVRVEHKRNVTDFTLDKGYYRNYQIQNKYGNNEINRSGFQETNNNHEYNKGNLQDNNQISMEDTKTLIDKEIFRRIQEEKNKKKTQNELSPFNYQSNNRSEQIPFFGERASFGNVKNSNYIY